MAYKMILNKEKFLKTEFGTGLQECIAAWDMYLTKLSGLNYQPSGEYAEMRKGATWCQAQWEVYKAAMKQFYSIEYNFTRTDNYYGVCIMAFVLRTKPTGSLSVIIPNGSIIESF